jgi:hypothetical protein
MAEVIQKCYAQGMEDQTLTNGLVAKRTELMATNAELRERMAIVANDIEAVERVLESLGYQGEGAKTARAARVVLFYRNELRDYLRAEMAKSETPLTARELASGSARSRGRTGRIGGL